MTGQLKMELKKCGTWKLTNINLLTVCQLMCLFEPFFIPDLCSEITHWSDEHQHQSQSWRGERLCGAPGDPTEGCSNQGKGGGSRLIIYGNYSLLNPDLEDLFLI